MKLPSGREFYANCDIIGIDAEGNVSEGYDGHIDNLEPYYEQSDSDPRLWSSAEKVELADIMIARWMRFKEDHTIA